jgi:biopolymer transport protein ExbD
MKSFLPADEDMGFQMAPMIDIVFLLIIFFMSAANQRQAEKIKIEVPEASAAVVAKDQSARGTITIKEKGEIFLGTTPVTLDQLEPLIAASVGREPNLRIFLRADARVHFQNVRPVMDKIAAAGISDIIFATYESK